MATLNSDVYLNGVQSTFLNTNKNYTVCLLNSEGNILAVSGIIKKTSSVEQYYINNKISWDSQNKQLIVSSLNFKETKSVVNEGADDTATQYSIAEVVTISSSTSPAYSGSDENYYWPDLTGSITHLVTGDLSSPIAVSAGNNFRFDQITVRFSEADTI